ncbi:ATP-binding protein [Carnobacterium sp. 17-4]|uniref:ATP-binding protein n=1 Tax=Carnobacterium sp. (strain 17-4) TaxID=208596 RepID=UPI0011D22244|nr:AAA family ATPase [Carnobacterium sp. 17-4]
MTLKIKSMEIYGYGKWVDHKIDDITNLQVFYGENEAGKTTLMSFIHSILFGFPSKISSELRYEPKSSSQYGGRLFLTGTQYGDVQIERVRGKANGTVTVTFASGETGGEEWLEKILSGLDKATYQALFSFNLAGLQKVQQLNREKLNRYFLSVGTIGNEQLLKVADKFQTEASKLFKPNGRVTVINKKMADVEAKRKQVKLAKEKNSQYMNWLLEKDNLEKELISLREQRTHYEDKVFKLNQLESNWVLFSEMQDIQHQIKKEQLEELPKDGLYQLNHYNQEINQLKLTITQQQEKLHYLRDKTEETRQLKVFIEHRDEMILLMDNLDHIQAKLQEATFIKETILATQHQFLREKQQLGLEEQQAIPAIMTEESRLKLNDLQVKQAQVEQRIKLLTERIAFLNFQQESLGDQLDKLEKRLWNNQTYQEVEDQLEKNNPDPRAYNKVDKQSEQKLSKGTLTNLVGGLLISILGLYMSNGIGLVLTTAGLGLIFHSIWSIVKKTKIPNKIEEIRETSYSFEEYIQQTEIRKQWREKLAEIDQVILELNEKQAQYEEAENKQLQTEKEFRSWKQLCGYPLEYSTSELMQETDIFEAIREKANNIYEKQTQLSQMENEIVEWKESIMYLQPVIFVDWNNNEQLIEGIKQFFKEAIADEEKLKDLTRQHKVSHQHIEQLIMQQKEFEQKRRRLLHAVKVKTEEEFRKKYVLEEELTTKKARLNLLEQQVGEYSALLEKYRDKAALVESIQGLKAKLQQLKESIEIKLNKKIKTEVALKNLEVGGAYSELLQEYANLKSETQILVDEWTTYKIAAELIERTLTEARKDRFPATIRDTTYFFAILTNRNYQKVFLKDQTITVQRKDGTLFEASELSQATAEQLYVALRFSFVKNANDLIQLPLLVDDGFVNFDQQRKKEMYQLLQRISEDIQVFYFTFDETVTDVFRKEQIEML